MYFTLIEIFTYNKMEQENQQDNTKQFYSVKEGMLSSPYYPRKIQYLRERRNELLKETDYSVLPDVVMDENK